MAWIEIHQTLPRHRKTLATAGRLSVDRHTIIGHLLELWTWGIDNVPSDGFMGNISFQELAIAADWRGDENSFVSALIDSGFIDKNPDGLWLHDWYEYAGKLLEKREKEKERSKNRRSTTKKPMVDRRLTDGRPQDRPMVDREKLRGTVPNSTKRPDDVTHTGAREAFAVDDALSLEKSMDPKEELIDLTEMWRECDEIYQLQINHIQIELVNAYVTDDGLEPAIIPFAFRESRARGKSLDYAMGILRNIRDKGIRTLDDAKMDREIFDARKRASQTRASPKLTNMDAVAAFAAKVGARGNGGLDTL